MVGARDAVACEAHHTRACPPRKVLYFLRLLLAASVTINVLYNM